MSSMLEQLWPIFLAEVGEKLDVTETLIAKAIVHDSKNTGATDIDALFREFHTIKSNLSMVGFKEPMEIANACEDVLHGLRKSKTPPNRDMLHALLESVDWIKQQVADATPSQLPNTSHDALHKKLAPFRQQEELSPSELTEPAHQELVEKKTHDLTEEKEALEIDTLRISSSSLDELVTQITQLILVEHQISQLSNSKNITHRINDIQSDLQKVLTESDHTADIHKTFESILREFVDNRQFLLHLDARMRTINENIQSGILSLRTIPLSTIFTRLPRIVRQKAATHGKQVQLATDGGDITIDKSMLDVISEPLIHLLHNAVTHGIESPEERRSSNKPETGKINIVAKKIGELVQIDIQDDGCGANGKVMREKIHNQALSDTPNLTTGLDVVRDHLLRIGGSIQIKSTPTEGTQFTLHIPKTVAIQNTLLIEAGKQQFAIPSRHVMEVLEVSPNELTDDQGLRMLDLRGQSIPVYSLSRLLQLSSSSPQDIERVLLVILQQENNYIALHIDDAIGRQDLFLRNTHQDLRSIPSIGGISLLGNGRAVVILDCESLFRLTCHYIEPRHAAF
ncbi:MAG: chemotaxis protein CheW [Pseudomonadales bacterium]